MSDYTTTTTPTPISQLESFTSGYSNALDGRPYRVSVANRWYQLGWNYFFDYKHNGDDVSRIIAIRSAGTRDGLEGKAPKSDEYPRDDDKAAYEASYMIALLEGLDHGE